MTLCYSISQQPAAPIVAALGKSLPTCEVTIDQLGLVVQHGLPLCWDWHRVGTARLKGRRAWQDGAMERLRFKGPVKRRKAWTGRSSRLEVELDGAP